MRISEIRDGLIVLLGLSVTACSAQGDVASSDPEGPSVNVEDAQDMNISDDLDQFVLEYLESRFNASRDTSMGMPRTGFRIAMMDKTGEWDAEPIRAETVLTMPQYPFYPVGGKYELPNVVWRDGATPSAFNSLRVEGIGRRYAARLLCVCRATIFNATGYRIH